MIIPEFLKPGDKVGFVAPARSTNPEEIEKAVKIFESHNFQVIFGSNIFKKYHQYSGTDMERAADIQLFIDDPEIKAIFCVRGGYGSIRTLQLLNFRNFVKNPKWFVGYSDFTVFHSYINTKLNIETLHAPMPFNFGKEEFDDESITKTFEILSGKIPEYLFEPNILNCEGRAKGLLVGGNLSVLYSLRGTPADFDSNGKILFLEDLDEYLYHIDRMMTNFKYGNKLLGLRAVIVGEMKDMKDNNIPFGKTAYEIISEILTECNIPVCFGFPAGHGAVNNPLILGHEVILNIGKKCYLKFS